MSEENPEKSAKPKRTRVKRNFPASTFEESLEFAREVFKFGSGQSVRRLSLFDHLGKSPESGPSRQLITNANKYGFTSGGYQGEFIELTPLGIQAVNEVISEKQRIEARLKLAIDNIEPFSKLYERFKGNRLPAKAALKDALHEFGVSEAVSEEAVDIFIVNLRYLGVLQTLSGAERIVTFEHLLENLSGSERSIDSESEEKAHSGAIITSTDAKFETTAFFVAPIGNEDSEQRRHSDLFLSTFVEPVLDKFNLKVVRADSIGDPGIITKQIVEYLLKSRLVVADLSFHNPNVFYELAIRHLIRKPVVQIMRTSDRIPFDVSQIRTVKIDTTDIYSLVPRIDSYRSEISAQVRRALENPDAVDNPVSTFFPALKIPEMNL